MRLQCNVCGIGSKVLRLRYGHLVTHHRDYRRSELEFTLPTESIPRDTVDEKRGNGVHGRRQGGLEERPRSADLLSTSRVRALMIGGSKLKPRRQAGTASGGFSPMWECVR